VTPVVVDASVSVKWAMPEAQDEGDIPQALAILQGCAMGTLALIEPPHWLAEILAVLTRRRHINPIGFAASMNDIGFAVDHHLDVYARAVQISQDLQHHLFDTLYHAVALAAPDRILVTADEHYFRKAESRGQIMRLSDWPLA
jgi:predicted nucleic acid-binding protein